MRAECGRKRSENKGTHFNEAPPGSVALGRGSREATPHHFGGGGRGGFHALRLGRTSNGCLGLMDSGLRSLQPSLPMASPRTSFPPSHSTSGLTSRRP